MMALEAPFLTERRGFAFGWISIRYSNLPMHEI
jgi:hypothetical protein